MNTFHSGALTSEHGAVGWNLYEPEVDEQFETLPFLRKDGTEPERMEYEDIANAERIYPDLKAAGVETHQVTPFPNGGTVPHTYDPEDLSTFPEAFESASSGPYPVTPVSFTIASVHQSLNTMTPSVPSAVPTGLRRMAETNA